MEGFCNDCGSNDVEVKSTSCYECKFCYHGKHDDGRFYKCTHDISCEIVNISNENVLNFACNKFEQNG